VKRTAIAIGVALLLTGCSRLQPTEEMKEYQAAAKTTEAQELEVHYPDEMKRAASYNSLAEEAKDDKEEPDMTYYAHLAYVWWQSAKLREDAKAMNAEREQLEKDNKQLEKELAEAKKRQKLAQATLKRMKEIMALEGKVAASAEANAAREAIGEALTALKEAQAVDADVHAAATFSAAEAKLKLATDALGKNKAKDAQSFAVDAKAGADAAKAEASPKYASTEADQAKMARQKALFDALSEVSGAQRSMVDGGGVTVTLTEAFGGSSVTITPGMTAQFNKVGDVAKNFSDYQLVIEGHTDSKGNKSKNLQLSDSRAKSVMAHLAGMGVAPDRMTALGKGSQEPVADNKTKDGRFKNRRIEILFVPSGK
jgi:outer membrane protein OmpA-like peptidoglycan-associated protein